ncbi:MAG: dynamin family protein [Planctomycetaceae bacterium]
MTDTESSVIKLVHKILERLGQTMVTCAIPSLHTTWHERWKPGLQQIAQEASHRPTVTIAVVGSTGAGKSTLLNALLGERILPVSNTQACTAAISEVTYADSAYTADIEFISRTDWQRELTLLLADVADEGKLARQAVKGDDRVAKAARDRLRVVYKMPDEEIRRGLKVEELQEPPEIKTALDTGRIQISAATGDKFKRQLRPYLDSQHPFWPLVRTVQIRGPFHGLTIPGVKLVDLPGLNDPNEAREQVTRNYLKECRFVWIVFNIKRALTRDIQAVIQSDDFVRELVLRGRDNTLTFVGTHSDDIDRESAIDEFGLDDDATESRVVEARNTRVRGVIAEQLHELASRLARAAGAEQRTQELSDRLQKSCVFTVSARDYFTLMGISGNKNCTLEDPANTEIPALREHLAAISAGHTEGVHQDSLRKRLDLLVSEIKHRVQTERLDIVHARDITVKKRKEIRETLQRLLSFLERDLDNSCKSFVQEMNGKHDLLEERLLRAFERGRCELQQVTQTWNHIHWMTLRAIVRRKGQYKSPTSGYYDFAADISRPALEMITFAWDDFFGDKMRHALTVGADNLTHLAREHRNEILGKVIQQVGAESKSLSEDLQQSLEVNGRLIREYVGQCQSKMSGTLSDVRSSLHEQIPLQVAANMRKAYEAAEDESGTGMKQRILELLSAHASRVSEGMFNDARDRIMEGVRRVTDLMSQDYREMARGVADRLSIPIANFANEDALHGEESAKELTILQSTLRELDDVGVLSSSCSRSEPCH